MDGTYHGLARIFCTVVNLLYVLGIQLSPIAAPMPTQKLSRLLVVPNERLGSARRCNKLPERKLSVSSLTRLNLREQAGNKCLVSYNRKPPLGAFPLQI
jgi:hypothetical protein